MGPYLFLRVNDMRASLKVKGRQRQVSTMEDMLAAVEHKLQEMSRSCKCLQKKQTISRTKQDRIISG